MGVRRKRLDLRQADQRVSRRENGMLKTKERARRHNRLVEKLKAGRLPYSPTVMSWLSAELDKPSRLIQQADVDQFLARSQGS